MIYLPTIVVLWPSTLLDNASVDDNCFSDSPSLRPSSLFFPSESVWLVEQQVGTTSIGSRPSPLYSNSVRISANFKGFLIRLMGVSIVTLFSSVLRRFLALFFPPSSDKTGVPAWLDGLNRFLDPSTDELRLRGSLWDRTSDSVRESLRDTVSELGVDGVVWESFTSGVLVVAVFRFWWTASLLSMRSNRASSYGQEHALWMWHAKHHWTHTM